MQNQNSNQCYGALWESREEESDQFWGRQDGAEAFIEVVVSEQGSVRIS